MDKHLGLMLTVGFIIFCIGIIARSYMTIRANGGVLFRVTPSGSTEVDYMKLVREGRAPLWPLIVSTVCIIAGIVIIFGSLFWTGMHSGH